VVKLLRDTWLIYQQEVALMMRSVTMIAFSLAQPITYLVLFAPFLKTTMAGQGANSYAAAYRIYVPGLLVAMGLFGGLFAGYGLLMAIRAGIIERCRVTPISRIGLLLGRALMHVTLIVSQGVIITIASLPFGLRVNPLHLLAAYALLAMMALMATSISYDLALLVPDTNSLGMLVNTAGQPISLLAGVLIPISLAPLWIRDLALGNPFAWATNAIRALFTGHAGDDVVWQGALIITVLAALCVVLSSKLFNRKIA
jgi:ABC-2 type transport system permease protein